MAPKTTTDPSTSTPPPPGAFRRCSGRVRGAGISCAGCFGDAESKPAAAGGGLQGVRRGGPR
ncbi:hypothetical protein OsJ_01465 [Oryza sativa Japonica Group]|uniref:Uncharacterized protein n=1 Tax=Oryza sativa subsp. japonica TaxID=39947 RepID=A2ZSA4_ORYSJ|nr:hypothetical protein OsJ_01465 [Oryza sativa Japonica Group]